VMRTMFLIAASVLLVSCEPSTTRGRVGVMSAAELDAVQKKIAPTKHFVARADRDLLWKAAQGYMERVFSLATVERDFLETETVEWIQFRLPHRTRITVEVGTDRGDKRNAWVYVVALNIEPVVALENARTGEPLKYGWNLTGNRPRVEEVVMGQIVRRYLLLRDGRDPETVPLEGPIPGITPKGDFYRSGVGGRDK